MSIFNSSVIVREQCIPRVAQSQHANYARYGTHNFCKLGCKLYCIYSIITGLHSSICSYIHCQHCYKAVKIICKCTACGLIILEDF